MKLLQKFILISIIFGIFFSATPVYAHVVVKPNEVGVGERVTFMVSVPTEEETPTTGLRLLVPDGVENVRPNAKPGWNIELIKSDDKVTEIIWTGGNIPAEQKDDFVFTAQVPAKETNLSWKAYQTYGENEIVAWDADAKTVEDYTKKHPPIDGDHDHNAPKPLSVTNVINDLQVKSKSMTKTAPSQNDFDTPTILSILAFVFATLALGLQLKAKK